MFDSGRYEVRQKLRIGEKYNVYEDGVDDPILSCAKKKFRLKEDFRFTDPESGEERYRVKASSVLDIAAAYDIVDSRTEARIGSVKRNPISVFKQEYVLLGPDGTEVARVTEDGWLRAAVRRYVTTLLPFDYDLVTPDGRRVGEATESVSLRDRYAIEVDPDAVDPRLTVVALVVIDAIEGN